MYLLHEAFEVEPILHQGKNRILRRQRNQDHHFSTSKQTSILEIIYSTHHLP